MPVYYIRRGERTAGPFELPKLQEFSADGKLIPTDQLATNVNGPWTEAGRTKLFSPNVQASTVRRDGQAGHASGDAEAAAAKTALSEKQDRHLQEENRRDDDTNESTGWRGSPFAIAANVLALAVVLIILTCLIWFTREDKGDRDLVKQEVRETLEQPNGATFAPNSEWEIKPYGPYARKYDAYVEATNVLGLRARLDFTVVVCKRNGKTIVTYRKVGDDINGSLEEPSEDGLMREAAKGQVGIFKTAINMYKFHTRIFPNGLDGLITKPSDKIVGEQWAGPYLDTDKVPLDPWDHAYRFIAPGKHNTDSYDVWSVGPDGKDGTKDDIGNWE